MVVILEAIWGKWFKEEGGSNPMCQLMLIDEVKIENENWSLDLLAWRWLITWTTEVPMEWLRWKSPKVVFIGLSDTIACFCANVFFKSFSSEHSTYKSFPNRTYNPVIQADENKFSSISACYTHTACPGSSVVPLPANAGAAGDSGSIPRLERSPGGGNGNPLQYSCLDIFTDREEPSGL